MREGIQNKETIYCVSLIRKMKKDYNITFNVKKVTDEKSFNQIKFCQLKELP